MSEVIISNTKTDQMNKIARKTDSVENSIISDRRALKYNRLINNRNAACILRKNIIVINNVDVNNTIIESDYFGNNTLKTFDDYVSEEIDVTSGNIFKNLLFKTRQKKPAHKNFITEYLDHKRESLQHELKVATDCYKNKFYRKANDLYENVLHTIKNDNYPDEFMLTEYDIIAIKLVLVLTKIEICDHASLKTAEEILISLLYSYSLRLPCLYYYLGNVYYKFFNFQQATSVLKEGLEILEDVHDIPIINWPGTQDKMIEETDKEILEQNMNFLLKESNSSFHADAKCQYELCKIDNKNIYFGSPLFFGYVKVKCSNKCNVAYHKACWNNILKTCGIKNLKALLNQLCRTDDCLGNIDVITLYDENLKVLTTVSYSDKDENKNNSNFVPSTNINITRNKKKEKEKKTITKTIQSDHVSKSTIVDKENLSKTDIKKESVTKINQTSNTIEIPNIEDNKPLESKVTNSDLNSDAKDYVPMNLIEMFQEEHQNMNVESHVSKKEYDDLKREISVLREELFKANENYNNILAEKEQLLNHQRLTTKRNVYTETVPYCCKNCKVYETQLNETKKAWEDTIIVNDQLEIKIKELKHEINELKIARYLDKEILFQIEQKHTQEKDILLNNLQELSTEKEKISKELSEFKLGKEPKTTEYTHAQNLLVEQIEYIRNFYICYMTIFENKCKHMIWELEDIKTLTSSETIPSIQEVKENLILWTQALEQSTINHNSVVYLYDLFINNIKTNFTINLLPTPIPPLINEPPSIILRHFKTFFIMNKRLEEDLNKHITNYYTMLSMPYPGNFPLDTSQFTSQPDVENIFTPKINTNTKIKVWSPPPRMTNVSKKEKYKPPENIEEAANSTGMEINYIGNNPVKSKPNYNSEIKEEIIGEKGLIFKLQQKYPLVSPKILEESVKILRSARGGLSGIDSQTMMKELRIIIKNLSKNDQQQSECEISKSKDKNPWKQINNEVQWQNTNLPGNCSICFETMNKRNSSLLRCKHVFHSVCVKKWLKTNGICPICRAFTTLDDEFPPLK